MRFFIFLLTVATAGAAIAHQGVKNPVVLERMEAMKDVAASTKSLGQMAKGEVAFDAEVASRAAAAILDQTDRVPVLFKEPETDPKSEATPNIWTNWDDFLSKNSAMALAAKQFADVSTLEDLRAAMGALGQSCKACHADYRIEN